MTTIIALVVLAGVTAVVSFGRTITRLSHLEPGPDRTAAINSLWSLGGSAGIVLSIAMGTPPFSMGLVPRVGVLGAAAVLIAIAGVKNRGLMAARQHTLLQAGVPGATLADQLEVLEGQRLQYRRIPLRFWMVLMGGKAIAAATCISAMRFTRDPVFMALFGALAALNIGWLMWDLFSALRRKAGRDRIDREIASLLGSYPATLPGTTSSGDGPSSAP